MRILVTAFPLFDSGGQPASFTHAQCSCGVQGKSNSRNPNLWFLTAGNSFSEDGPAPVTPRTADSPPVSGEGLTAHNGGIQAVSLPGMKWNETCLKSENESLNGQAVGNAGQSGPILLRMLRSREPEWRLSPDQSHQL